jgi:hypothetical protein
MSHRNVGFFEAQKIVEKWSQPWRLNPVFSSGAESLQGYIHRTLARPILTYGSEARTIRKADEKRLQAAEMKFVRKTTGLTLLDHKRNEEILKNLKVEPVSRFIQNYHANWKDHIQRIDYNRVPNKFLHYRPHGKSLGKPLKS